MQRDFAPVVGSTGAVNQPSQTISVVHVLFMAGVHAGAVAAFAWLTWTNLAVMLALYALTGLGITVGYHRLLSHRSFRTPRWVRNTIATIGCAAMQGGPLRWAADHRTHHFHSDSESDPHDIERGFFFAHMGWLFYLFPADYDERRILHHTRDLAHDPYLRRLDRYHYLPGLIVGALLLTAGGLPLFLWGFCARLVLLYHSTWMVNSAAHKWGYRSFPEVPGTNNWLVALLAFGEGWHNNHHAWPSSARQGLRNWELDVSWAVIRLLHKLGLASDVMHVRLDEAEPGRSVLQRA